MLICFIGMDGSGKTTLAKKACKILKKSNKDVEYRHILDYSIIKKLSCFRKPSKKSKSETKEQKWSMTITILRQIIFILDIILFYFIKFFHNRKKILILDRYFYDTIPRIKFFSQCAVLPISFYLNFIPKPNEIIYVKLDPKTAFKRKPEDVESLYHEAHKTYENITKKLKHKTIINENRSVAYKSLKNILDHL